MIEIILNWIDLAWLPIAFLAVGKKNRVKSVLFALSCIFMLRLQVELMHEIGFDAGILTFIQWPALYKGMAIYGFFMSMFFGLSAVSKNTDPYVFMGASISIFFLSFCISSVVMVL
ncbi:MAG: hypothetical protein GW903_05585 [Alphaproteobacteria bacterium]|nr:hypothetical protein [Alphaproteobacteria bacterium]NCQ88350.1 hypothetical protein [Alphaproteobacteria bacterium]NCT05893.1 hypothetical protein [Alphaproteobacteria bacterium]